MFSGCPSVRPSKAWNTSFDLYMGPLVHPTNRNRFTACPSVYINGSVVLGADESPRPCGTPSWYTPLSWMILSKQKNLHLFSSQYICVFSKMSVRPSVRLERFPGICRGMHRGIGLKFYMLVYLHHLQNWLVFQILALFWLSETGQILGFRAFPGERMEGMTWNFACWCILTISRTD